MSKSGSERSVKEQKVNDHRFDGVVETYTKNGWRQDVEMIRVKETETDVFGSLDGDGTVERPRRVTRAEMREKHAYGVMIALAEYLDFEVRPI